jgi:parallel beta-helix repeat protein
MKKEVVKFTLIGILLFLFIYLIFFISNGKSNPDTSINACSVLTSQGEYYFLSGDILNNSITDNCINISAQNVTLDCQGHYIYSIQNYSGVYSTQVNTTIKNCNITMGSGKNANANGIYFYSVNNGTIFNNSIFGDSSAGISLFNSMYNNITNNNVTSLSGNGIYLSSSANNFLTSNIGTSDSGAGIWLLSSPHTTLRSNNGTGNTAYGIYIQSSDYVILNSNIGISNTLMGINIRTSLKNNLISNIGISNSNPGIWIFSSSNNCNLTLNTGISNSNPGIYLSSTINNNLLTSNIGISNSSCGISLSASSNNILISNTGISNSSAGFCLSAGSLKNTLTNSISNNNVYGLDIINSNGTIVTNLAAKNNSLYGVFLEGKSWNNVITNSFIQLNNASGFALNSSSGSPNNNSIYNNYFNNSIAFSNFSASSLNYFNNTKILGTNIIGGNYLGGNYWAAPNGSGFSQTCTSSTDGICNTAYNLDGVNYDYLPLACIENWVYSDWGSCIGGTQTRTYYDSNLCQTYKNYNPGILSQSCGGDLGGHLAQGQGGGGGATTFTQSIENITPVQPVEITINNSGMDLSSLIINVKKSVSDISINITKVNQTESGLPVGRLYQAFKINPGIDNSEIINATINFKINKTWLAENNITFHSKGNRFWIVENDIIGNITLYRNPDGTNSWIPLVTTFLSEDDKSYYFSAYSLGFSTFAIFLNKYDCLPNSARCDNNEVQLCLGNSTWLVTEHCSDTCQNGKCTSSFYKSNQFYFLIIAIIVATIVIVIIALVTYKRRKNKRKIRKEIRRNKKLKGKK